jgi:hypothetical protein
MMWRGLSLDLEWLVTWSRSRGLGHVSGQRVSVLQSLENQKGWKSKLTIVVPHLKKTILCLKKINFALLDGQG